MEKIAKQPKNQGGDILREIIARKVMKLYSQVEYQNLLKRNQIQNKEN